MRELARDMLRSAGDMLHANVRTLTLDEALFADGGFRSILGVLKHIGGWTHVYRAYAFDDEPEHWARTSWPRGLRDTVETSNDYVDEIVRWIEDGLAQWDAGLSKLPDEALAEVRPVHWGQEMPLIRIVTLVSQHIAYHTGELNMLLSISRGEAWEWGEEVEENHIDTYGHGVRGPWMNDEVARYYEEQLRIAHEARVNG
jgi:uncharacterized damage-inducible protein DinB